MNDLNATEIRRNHCINKQIILSLKAVSKMGPSNSYLLMFMPLEGSCPHFTGVGLSNQKNMVDAKVKNRLLKTVQPPFWLLSCNLSLFWVIHSGGSQMPCCEQPSEGAHRAKIETSCQQPSRNWDLLPTSLALVKLSHY